MPADKCNLELGAWGVTYRATVHDTTPHESPSPAQRHQRHPRHNSAPLVCGAPFTPLPLSAAYPALPTLTRPVFPLLSQRSMERSPELCARDGVSPRRRARYASTAGQPVGRKRREGRNRWIYHEEPHTAAKEAMAMLTTAKRILEYDS